MSSASDIDTLRAFVQALSPAARDSLLDSLVEEKETLPSFCATKWADFFDEHGKDFGFLSPSFGYSNHWLEDDVTPTYQLPRYFHKEVCEIAMLWMNAYSFHTEDRYKEEANLRLLEPFLIPVISLFQGQILDKPVTVERRVKTKYETGGRVEHEMFVIGGVLFLVVELKQLLGLGDSLGDYVAQLFLELLSAAERNGQSDFGNLKVYGLLSNFSRYYFYTYDPKTKKFFKNEEIKIHDETIEAVFTGMIQVCNKIFGLVLTAYIDGLKTIVGWSHNRARNKDSTRPWETALRLAEACQRKFKEPVTDLDGIEKRGSEALEKLKKSALSMPANCLWPDEEPTMPADRAKFAEDLTIRVYEAQLRKAKQQGHQGS